MHGRWKALALCAFLCAGGCGSDPAPSDAGEVTEDAGGVDAGASWPTCAVMSALTRESLMAPAGGSGAYRGPGAGQVEALRAAAAAALAGDVGRASEAARRAEYRICRGEGAEADLLLFEPTSQAAGHARAIVRAGGVALVLEAPHPFYDTDTLAQSISLFEQLGARALIVSGTHRCAGNMPSGCDGTTSACGSSSPYPESDPAHAVAGTFHALHVALAESLDDAVMVSVHGFGATGASVSDGTTGLIDPGAPAARLARALSAQVSGVTSCNEGSGAAFEVRLCGTTNVQGRQLNGAADACSESRPAGLGRFIHLEQSRAVRADVSAVTSAFREAFP